MMADWFIAIFLATVLCAPLAAFVFAWALLARRPTRSEVDAELRRGRR